MRRDLAGAWRPKRATGRTSNSTHIGLAALEGAAVVQTTDADRLDQAWRLRYDGAGLVWRLARHFNRTKESHASSPGGWRRA